MDPGACVEQIVRSIALQGSYGASLEQIWSYSAIAAGQDVSPFLQALIWRWVVFHPDIEVFADRKSPPIDRTVLENNGIAELRQKFGDLWVLACEAAQWRELAHCAPGTIGNYPWEILCCVSRAGPPGINAVDLRKETGQDARSIHGRVALLVEMGLISRYPTVANGANTSLLVLTQYETSKDNEAMAKTVSKDGWNPSEVAKNLVQLCKSGPNGIRLSQDLVEELGFKNIYRGIQLFRAMVRRLVALKVIRRVDVYEAADPSALYRCIQYLKDIQDSTDLESGRDDQEDEDNNENNDNDNDDLEDQRPLPTSNLADMIVVDPSTSTSSETTITANLYYSLANQIYDFVAASSVDGVTAMDIYNKITGRQYTKVLGRTLDALCSSDIKQGPFAHLGYLGLVRAVDFAGRTKFYRYFTRLAFAYRQSESIPSEWGCFSTLKSASNSNIALVESKNVAPLPGFTGLIETDDGTVMPHFHGDSSIAGTVIASSESAAVRGRPRKDQKRKDKQGQKQKTTRKSADTSKQALISERVWIGGQPAGQSELHPSRNFVVPALESTKESNDTKVASEVEPKRQSTNSTGSNSTSVQSLAKEKRKEWILQLLKENNGIIEGGHPLQKALNEQFAGDSQLDRRTVNNAVISLVSSETLKQYVIAVPGQSMRTLLCDPRFDANDPEILAAKRDITESAMRKRLPAISPVHAPKFQGEISLLSQSIDKPRRYKVLDVTPREKGLKKKKKQGPGALDVISNSIAAISEPPKKRGRSRSKTAVKAEPVPITPRPLRSTIASDVVDPELMVPRALTGLPPMPPQTIIPQSQLDQMVTGTDVSQGMTEVDDLNGLELDGDRMMKAVVISRELYGRGTAINWGMVVADVPGLSINQAKRKWPTVRDGLGGTKRLHQLSEQFASLFEKAYAKNDISVIDPESPSFRLQTYIDWWDDNEQNNAYIEGDEAVESRESFEQKYGKIRPTPKAIDPLEHASTMPSMIRLEELLLATPFGVDMVKREEPKSLFTPAEMRLRAVIAADQESYNPAEAAAELGDLSEDVAAQSIENLANQRFAQYLPKSAENTLPGRSYGLNERALTLLASKLAIDTPVVAASLARDWFDTEYKAVPASVDEKLLIPLIDGVCSETAKIQRDSGHKTGRISSHYRSRMISKDMLDGKVSVALTSSKPLGAVKRPVVPKPESPLPEAPFIWQTKRLTSQSIWQTLVLKIVSSVLLKPGYTTQLLVHCLQSVLAPAEVRGIVDWLVKRGNIVNRDGALFVQPDWYIDLY